METKYYLPISSKCLANYFSSACIMPTKYFSNRQVDIQNKFEDFLLITNFHGLNEVDCCLELVLTENEISVLFGIQEGFYLYNKPLPISRIKTILFTDKKIMEQTIFNIVMSTAFIPEEIIKCDIKFENIKLNNVEIPADISKSNWSGKIKRFDSFLGGFALMRLSGEDYMNYSEHYFSTLSFFNEVIKNELLNSDINIDNLFIDAFFGEVSFKKLYPIINKVVDENDLIQIAKEEKQYVIKDKVTRIIDLNSLEKASYIVAVLNMYGVADEAKKKRIDGIILSNFKSEIKPDKSEVVALCYGLNKGYSVFPRSYKSGNVEKSVKFQLNSQLDYYTIESLYQFVFNDKKSEEFPYIDYWCPKQKNKLFYKNKTDFQVLDVLVIGKKKPKVFSKEYLADLLQRFFLKDSEAFFKDFVDKIRTTVYNDTIEESNEVLGHKDDEIKRLYKEKEKYKNLEAELTELKNENDKIKNENKESLAIYKEPLENKTVLKDPNVTSLNYSDKTIFLKQVLKYKTYPKKMLENEAKAKDIIIPPKATLDDIIVLLMTTQNNSKDSKLTFPE